MVQPGPGHSRPRSGDPRFWDPSFWFRRMQDRLGEPRDTKPVFPVWLLSPGTGRRHSEIVARHLASWDRFHEIWDIPTVLLEGLCHLICHVGSGKLELVVGMAMY